jgi:hypothetical protein
VTRPTGRWPSYDKINGPPQVWVVRLRAFVDEESKRNGIFGWGRLEVTASTQTEAMELGLKLAHTVPTWKFKGADHVLKPMHVQIQRVYPKKRPSRAKKKEPQLPPIAPPYEEFLAKVEEQRLKAIKESLKVKKKVETTW